MSDIPSQRGLKSEEQPNEVKIQLEAQKRRYEKLKYMHLQAGEITHELRQSFQTSLNKINNLDTRDVSVRELRQLIDRNVSNEALKIFLGTLGEIKKVKSAGAREQEVLLIGFIAQVYGERLIEGDAYMKNIGKSLEIIREFFADSNRSVHEAASSAFCDVYVREFFADSNRSVHEAASSAFCDVYVHSMPKDNIDLVVAMFFDPLETAMTSGVNVKAQQAASLCIFKWTTILIKEENTPIVNVLFPRIIALYVKLRVDFPDLISAIGVIVGYMGVRGILHDVHYVLKKTLQYLNVTGTNTHPYKIEACKLLSCMARKLQGIADLVIEPYHNEVIHILQQVKIDKLQSVQIAARQALTDWKNLEQLQKDIENKKMQEESVLDDKIIKTGGRNCDISPSRMGPNNFKAIRELAKRNKKNTESWGLAKPKYLEKKTGNYSVSPSESRENFRKAKEEMFFVNAIVPKEGINKHVMEVIQKKNHENRARDEILYDRDSPEPAREVFIKHVPGKENMNRLSKQIEETFRSMENAMDQGFTSIEARLQNLDTRMDVAYDKLQTFNSKPQMPSFIHPPKLENATVCTQTQNNIEIQAAMSQTNLSSPNSLHSQRAIDPLSQAWVEVLQWINENNVEEAYKRVLLTGDDIYLLRLMHKTGVCVKHLSGETCRKVMQRLGMIMNSCFLETLGMSWVGEALKEKVFQRMGNEDKENIFESMQRYSALPGEEGDTAAEIMKNLKF
ncbi:hypothetical protein SteCoe_20794 [Stentor coeruleus]|uniref:TOG domain-containing protein n=1 Tax=Stentor coeruleus TaxID=5963 RepID=A0A1R2BRB7_9CILI|nr:hypothetical protein SteCoe_20794 [Stentor coeruleus]